jgi:hypothetical protein
MLGARSVLGIQVGHKHSQDAIPEPKYGHSKRPKLMDSESRMSRTSRSNGLTKVPIRDIRMMLHHSFVTNDTDKRPMTLVLGGIKRPSGGREEEAFLSTAAKGSPPSKPPTLAQFFGTAFCFLLTHGLSSDVDDYRRDNR